MTFHNLNKLLLIPLALILTAQAPKEKRQDYQQHQKTGAPPETYPNNFRNYNPTNKTLKQLHKERKKERKKKDE